MKSIEVKAYAKINFILNVLGKRDDGYHEVETFMQAIDLFDTVRVEVEEPVGRNSYAEEKAAVLKSSTEAGAGVRKGSEEFAENACGSIEICLKPGSPKLPSGEGNLACRAALLMHSLYRKESRLRISIDIEKRIPIAAGLAGGSADAAAVITALGRLWGIKSLKELCEAGSKLGSDVPFCVLSQNGISAAVGRGRGNELSPAKAVDCSLALSTPDIEVSTPAVYGELKPEDYRKPYDIAAFESAESLGEKLSFCGNHLQAPSLRLFPQTAAVLEAHRALPGGLYTQLSGSGPSVFTVFDRENEAPIGNVKNLTNIIVLKTLLY